MTRDAATPPVRPLPRLTRPLFAAALLGPACSLRAQSPEPPPPQPGTPLRLTVTARAAAGLPGFGVGRGTVVTLVGSDSGALTVRLPNRWVYTLQTEDVRRVEVPRADRVCRGPRRRVLCAVAGASAGALGGLVVGATIRATARAIDARAEREARLPGEEDIQWSPNRLWLAAGGTAGLLGGLLLDRSRWTPTAEWPARPAGRR